jgi:hypothetical protein
MATLIPADIDGIIGGGGLLAPLGDTETRHASKILLEHVSAKRGENNPLTIYRHYLKSATSLNVNYKCVSMLSEAKLGDFYQIEQPLREPKYFNFFSGQNLAKLETCLQTRLVILQHGNRKNKDYWYKVHDYRVYNEIRGIDDWPVQYIVLIARGVFFYFFEPTATLLATERWYVPEVSETMFYAELSLYSGCLVESVWRSIGNKRARHESHSALCASLKGILLTPSAQVLDEFRGAAFILATHLQTNPRSRTRRMLSPKGNMFGILAVYGDEMAKNTGNLPVICITANRSTYRLKASYAQQLQNIQQKQRREMRQSFPAPAHVLDECRSGPGRKTIEDGKKSTPCSAREAKEAREQRERDLAQAYYSDPSSCPCDQCRNAGDFLHNMSSNGPQKLYKSPLSLFDLLKMVGRLDARTEAVIQHASALSVASFDVESLARPADESTGNEDVAFPEETISKKKIPGRVYAVHEPALIGFIDQLMAENGEPVHISSGEGLEGQFLERATLQRGLARRRKKELLQELLDWVGGYRRAHYLFHCDQGLISRKLCSFLGDSPPASPPPPSANKEDAEDDDDRSDDSGGGGEEEEEEEKEDAAAAAAAAVAAGREIARKLRAQSQARAMEAVELSWRHSVFGLIEARLRRLLEAYTVFGFNAESFDMIILCSNLCTYAKEHGRKTIRMHREGGKIRWMTIDGLRIAEIKRLLPPGMSLAALAKTCGLEESKGIFPFDRFTDLKFLREPRLPKDCADWASSLNPGRGPTQDEVDRALREFEDSKFESVGDYLEHYLGLDVIILQKAIIAMKREYYDILGLDFVEYNKFTVSSLSASGAQHSLARAGRIGQFFPNHSRMYSVSFFLFFFFFFFFFFAPPLCKNNNTIREAAQGRNPRRSDGAVSKFCRRGRRPDPVRGAAAATDGEGGILVIVVVVVGLRTPAGDRTDGRGLSRRLQRASRRPPAAGQPLRLLRRQLALRQLG